MLPKPSATCRSLKVAVQLLSVESTCFSPVLSPSMYNSTSIESTGADIYFPVLSTHFFSTFTSLVGGYIGVHFRDFLLVIVIPSFAEPEYSTLYHLSWIFTKAFSYPSSLIVYSISPSAFSLKSGRFTNEDFQLFALDSSVVFPVSSPSDLLLCL